MLPSLDDSPSKNNKYIDGSFPVILLIKESWLPPSKHGCPRCYLSLMNNSMHKRWHIRWFSRDIVDQRILQSDWTRGSSGHIQSRVVASDATFSWWLFASKKSKISLDSFQRYWWSNNLQSDWIRGTSGRTQIRVVV